MVDDELSEDEASDLILEEVESDMKELEKNFRRMSKNFGVGACTAQRRSLIATREQKFVQWFRQFSEGLQIQRSKGFLEQLLKGRCYEIMFKLAAGVKNQDMHKRWANKYAKGLYLSSIHYRNWVSSPHKSC